MSNLPPPEGMRALAYWLDRKHPNDPVPEVQTDLRRWADEWENMVLEEKENDERRSGD